MNGWKMIPQDLGGEYTFTGQQKITLAAFLLLEPDELAWMMRQLRSLLKRHGATQHRVTFECEDGRVIWIADNLHPDVKANASKADLWELDFYKIMLPDEY